MENGKDKALAYIESKEMTRDKCLPNQCNYNKDVIAPIDHISKRESDQKAEATDN